MAGDDALTKESVLAYKSVLVGTYAVASANSILSSLNCYFDMVGCGDCHVKTLRRQRLGFLPKGL